MPRSGFGFPSLDISVNEKIRETEGFSTETARIILRNLVHLDQPFESSPAAEDAIREDLRSLREEKTYSAAKVRARIAALIVR